MDGGGMHILSQPSRDTTAAARKPLEFIYEAEIGHKNYEDCIDQVAWCSKPNW